MYQCTHIMFHLFIQRLSSHEDINNKEFVIQLRVRVGLYIP